MDIWAVLHAHGRRRGFLVGSLTLRPLSSQRTREKEGKEKVKPKKKKKKKKSERSTHTHRRKKARDVRKKTNKIDNKKEEEEAMANTGGEGGRE